MLVLFIIKYSWSSVYPADTATRPLCECSHGEGKGVRRRGVEGEEGLYVGGGGGPLGGGGLAKE